MLFDANYLKKKMEINCENSLSRQNQLSYMKKV